MTGGPYAVDRCQSGVWRTRMKLTIETEQEVDGRWIAEVPELPGVRVYAPSETAAKAKAEALALRVLADRLELGEAEPFELTVALL